MLWYGRGSSLLSPAGRGSQVVKRSVLAIVLLAVVVPAFAQDGATILEEPATLLEPREPRGERDQDQLAAAAHFAQARLLLKRGERHRALQHLQRAWRYDEDGAFIAREIIPLASSLGRRAEAARYAVLAAERRPSDFPMLTQLGNLLVSQNQYDRALRMFERAAPLDAKRDATLVTLSVEMGRLYLLTEEPAKAAERFDIVWEALEDPAQFGMSDAQREKLGAPEVLYAVIAESFLAADDSDRAEEAYRKADAAKPNAALLAFRLARIAAKREAWSEASEQLEKYLAAGSEEAGTAPYELLRDVLEHSETPADKLDTAFVDRLRELLSESASNAPLAYSLAEELKKQNRSAEAVEAYQRAVALRPTASGYRDLTALHVEQRSAGELLDLLTDITRRVGGIIDPVEEELAELSSEPELVQTIGKLARKADSQSARLAGALTAMVAGSMDLGRELLEASLELKQRPAHEIYATAGRLVFDQDAAVAADLFQQALDTEPPQDKQAEYYFLLAGAQAVVQDFDAALAAAEQAAATSDRPQFQSRPAWITYYAKQYDVAMDKYLQLLEKYEGQYDSDQVRNTVRDAQLILSNIHVLQGRMPEAEEWLEKVLDEFPEDVGALNDLGYLWADQGKHLERALRMVQKAVAEEPENAAYRDSLGWAYYRLGRYEEAIQELERACEEENPDGVILDHLGDAYLGAGRHADAVRTWRSALEALAEDGEEETREAIRAKLQEHE